MIIECCTRSYLILSCLGKQAAEKLVLTSPDILKVLVHLAKIKPKDNMTIRTIAETLGFICSCGEWTALGNWLY